MWSSQLVICHPISGLPRILKYRNPIASHLFRPRFQVIAHRLGVDGSIWDTPDKKQPSLEGSWWGLFQSPQQEFCFSFPWIWFLCKQLDRYRQSRLLSFLSRLHCFYSMKRWRKQAAAGRGRGGAGGGGVSGHAWMVLKLSWTVDINKSCFRWKYSEQNWARPVCLPQIQGTPVLSFTSRCVPWLADPAPVNRLVVGCGLICWKNFRTEKLAEHGNPCLQSARLGGGGRRSRSWRLSSTWSWRQPGLQWHSISKKPNKHM